MSRKERPGFREQWRQAQQDMLQQDEHRRWYATRRRRRALVGAAALALGLVWAGAAVSWNLAPSDTAMYWTLGMFGVAAVIALPALGVLNIATRGTASLSEDRLDERQAGERARAYTAAHRAMLVVLAVFGAVVLGTDSDEVPMAAVAMGVVGLFMTHFWLPLLVAGWRMTDPPPDDEDELDDELDDEEP